MKKLLIALVAISSGAYALDTAPVYTLDKTHSFVEFHYNHFGYSNPSGKWLANGTINLNSDKLADSKADITIQIESLVTGIPALDHHLLSADFFDVTKYTTAHFISSKITAIDKTHFNLDGNLTIHGVTKPITLAVTENAHKINPMNDFDTVGYSATGSLKRSDFGLGAYVPNVSDEITLNIEIEARQLPTK
jgi:polyisoprenoid-binding protein YceI